MNAGYHETRLEADPRRSVVWKALWRYYFRHQIAATDVVLDLGAGYGDFINAVVAKRRIALDSWAGLQRHVAPDVEAITSSVTDLSAVEENSIDYAFASNLFEHLTKDELVATLAQLKSKLREGGKLGILQPNYRYAYREYFDDYTHVTIFSHISIADFLSANGWEVLQVQPRFLPLTVKSRLPTFPFLIGLYLASPFKPLGKQMMILARPRRT
jgi:SAM-dependent methyltransferase